MSTPRKRTKRSSYTLERLCAHHLIDEFHCGDQLCDDALPVYRGTLQSGGSPIVYVAVEPDSRVIGYIALDDINVTREDESYKLLYAANIAVTERYQHGRVAADLISQADQVFRFRQENLGGYRGQAVVAPWNDGVRRWLARQNFTEFTNYFWWRPTE